MSLKGVISLAMVALLVGCAAPTGLGDNTGTSSNGSGVIRGNISIPELGSAAGAVVVAEREIAGLSTSVYRAISESGGNLGVAAKELSPWGASAKSEPGLQGSRALDFFTTATKSDGSYELSGLPDGFYTLTVQKSDTLGSVKQNILVLSASPVVVDIVLTATGKLSGTVSLSVPGHSPLGTFVYLAGTSYIAAVDVLGAFTISNVPVGTYDVVYYRENYTPVTKTGMTVSPALTTALGNQPLAFKGHPPVIQTITAAPFIAGPGQQVVVNVLALDPDGQTLTYLWSAPSGSFQNNTLGTTIFTAPLTEGAVTLGMEVSDGQTTITGQVVVMVTTQTIVKVTGVDLPTALTINKGSTSLLSPVVSPANATLPAVTWSSSDPDIASVNPSGLVTAHAKGTVTITVTTQDGGYTDTCALTVHVPTTGISVNPTSLGLLVGQTQSLSAQVAPADATNNQFIWTSLNLSIATVDSNGLVTAVGPGTVQIRATATEGGWQAVTEVTVPNLQPISISVIPGVTPPVLGATPVTTISETDQYTGTITWSGSPVIFAASTVYTATITLTAKAGFTLTGVAADFFTVAGATSGTNSANSGVVMAVFPVTGDGSYTSATIGILRYIPAGRFQFDATATSVNIITKPYRMSQHEITRQQFWAIIGTDPSNTTYSSGTTAPVQMTNWYHAIAFCNKLSLAEGLTPVYTVSGVNFSTLTYAGIPTASNATWDAATATWANNGYRLPTGMEWMWAAMGAPADGQSGGTNTTGYAKAFAGSTGSNAVGDYAWWIVNTTDSKSHPVGGKLPNELGLYDMSGNVAEWIWDWNGYPTGTQTDYRGAASGTDRCVRGGYWSSSNFPFGNYSYGGPAGMFYLIGFRVVRP